MVGVGTDVLRALAGVLLLTAGLGVFIALWGAVRERRADSGAAAHAGRTTGQGGSVCCCAKALWLALLATVLGVLAGRALRRCWAGRCSSKNPC